MFLIDSTMFLWMTDTMFFLANASEVLDSIKGSNQDTYKTSASFGQSRGGIDPKPGHPAGHNCNCELEYQPVTK